MDRKRPTNDLAGLFLCAGVCKEMSVFAACTPHGGQGKSCSCEQ